jgi:hypothetical protein
MDAQARASGRSDVTRGKLILIGALAVVLAGVVYWNYFRDAAPPPTAARGAPSPAAASSARPTAKSSAAEGRHGAESPPAESAARPQHDAPSASGGPAWPEFELAEVIARDPFALPEQFPQPRASMSTAAGENIPSESEQAAQAAAAAQERIATLTAIREKGVELVLRSGREYVAKIGDLEVRVGDRIGGFRVVDISLRGVTLEGDDSR